MYGCAVLKNQAANAENQVKIAAAGGIDAIVRAPDAHPADAGVGEKGCGALNTLADNAIFAY